MAVQQQMAVTVSGVPVNGNVLTVNIGPDTWTHTFASETIATVLANMATAINVGTQTATYRYAATATGNVLQVYTYPPYFPSLIVKASVTANSGLSANVAFIPSAGTGEGWGADIQP